MKIAITGASRGYGKAIAETLTDKGHEVFELNRSEGYDISSAAGIKQIIDFTKNYTPDVFINNAYCDDYQCALFEQVFDVLGSDTSKTIVNVNSRAALSKTNGNPYFAYKKQLKKKTNPNFIPGPRCRIINVYPGYISTDHIIERNSKEGPIGSIMSLKEASDILLYAIEQPTHIELAEIAFWAINKI